MRRAAAALGLSLLAGCLPAVGPDYVRPEAAGPEAWRLARTDAESIADLKWWDLFEDSALRALIGQALAGNEDLRRAAASVRAYAARAGVARSDLFPQTQAEASATVSRVSERSRFGGGGFFDPTDDIYTVGGALAWEIDFWGRVRRAAEAARAELLASEQGRRGVVVSLVAAVAEGYLGLRELDAQLEIARRTLTARDEALRLARTRFEGGVITELDVRQAEAEAAFTAATIPDLERRIARAENALSLLLGRAPGPIERGRPIDELAVRAFIPAGLPSDLLERRPDVLEAEQRLVAANARIGATKALFFPRVSLTGNYGVESVQFSELFTQAAQTWSFGPAASMPLLTFGKVIGQLDAAEAEAEAALHAYREAALTALRETEDALVDHRKAIEQRAALEAQVRALRRALFLAEVRYREGYTDYVTVLDAQRSLLQAELELVGTERAQAAAAVQVYRALGGGWSAEDPAAALAEPEAPYLP